MEKTSAEAPATKTSTEGHKKHQFETNKKYYIISVYTISVVILCAIIVKLIFSWAATSSYINKYIGAIMPVIAGFFIAYLLNPVVNFFDRRIFSKLFKTHPRLSRSISILFTYIFVIGALILIIVYLIPQISDSIAELVSKIQDWYSQSIIFIDTLQARYPDIDFRSIYNKIQDSLIDFLSADRITGLVSNLVPKLFSTSIAVFKTVYNFLFAIMVSVYVLADKNRLVRNLKRFTCAFFKKERANTLIEVGSLTHHIFSSFITGKSLDSLIIGIITFIVMSLFQMPFALLISIIIGITNMIPYVGPWIGAVPGFLIILITDPITSLFYLVLVLAIQQFDGLYLGPRILGESTGLRPVWIIFAISIGGAVGTSLVSTALGMFLGVPSVAVIATLLDRYISKKLD